MKDNSISSGLSQIKKQDKTKRNKKVWIIFCAAAAALLVIGAIIFIPYLTNKDMNDNFEVEYLSTPMPVASETVEEYPYPDKKVIEGENGAIAEEEPNPGKVFISTTLENEVDNYRGEDVLFHVKITIFMDITDTFTYEGKTMDEYRSDPAILYYKEQYGIWEEEVYTALDQEMTAAEQRGEEYAQGWEKHDPGELFKEYWYETQPEDIIDEYEIAYEQYSTAHSEYEKWMLSDEYQKLRIELFEADCARLSNLGYYVEVIVPENMVPTIEGYLTGQQIEEFSVNKEYGYIIKWAEGDNSTIDA